MAVVIPKSRDQRPPNLHPSSNLKFCRTRTPLFQNNAMASTSSAGENFVMCSLPTSTNRGPPCCRTESIPVPLLQYKTALRGRRTKLFRKRYNKLLKAGVMVPSKSPWSSTPVLVGKPDGSICFCSDYWALNAVTARDNYPTPRVDEALDSMTQGVKYLIRLVAKQLFGLYRWHWRTGPRLPSSLGMDYSNFWSMPFGLRNAPATLQRFVNTLLDDLIGRYRCCFSYLDDFLIYSQTLEHHIRHIVAIYKRFRKVGFRTTRS